MNTPVSCSVSNRRAFTLIELITVIAIIALLAGMAGGGYMLAMKRSRVTAAQASVDMVYAAAMNYGNGRLDWPVSSRDVSGNLVQRSYRIWDWNRDQVIDGLPELERPAITGTGDAEYALYVSGYRGLVAMTGVEVRSLDTYKRPLDSWRNPIHIAQAAGVYGDGNFGVWSLGPDGLDGPVGSAAAADNITSWRRR